MAEKPNAESPLQEELESSFDLIAEISDHFNKTHEISSELASRVHEQNEELEREGHHNTLFYEERQRGNKEEELLSEAEHQTHQLLHLQMHLAHFVHALFEKAEGIHQSLEQIKKAEEKQERMELAKERRNELRKQQIELELLLLEAKKKRAEAEEHLFNHQHTHNATQEEYNFKRLTPVPMPFSSRNKNEPKE